MNLPSFHPRRTSQDWMQTYSGVMYYPGDPHPADVRLVDIAHHLSRLNRYTGAIIPEWYTVAEHSVLVSQVVPPEAALLGLLHDAPEAYLNDINRPAKRSPYLHGYKDLEKLNWRAIADHFGLPYELPACVHEADLAVLLAEQQVVMLPPPGDQGIAGKPAEVVIQCWSPNEAECRFLARYVELLSCAGV